MAVYSDEALRKALEAIGDLGAGMPFDGLQIKHGELKTTVAFIQGGNRMLEIYVEPGETFTLPGLAGHLPVGIA